VPHESVLDPLASTFNPLVEDPDEWDPDICPSTYSSAQDELPRPTEWVITDDAATGTRRITAAMARGTTAWRVLWCDVWVASKCERPAMTPVAS
jgi:hypothetical protein